ncbi:MAG TPA: hypothetical protein VFV92_08160 [Candidatus Bathyarchaeia archaeon]|nr:hypothetical protein [Candidatus Bathyarchaeia archaeon]
MASSLGKNSLPHRGHKQVIVIAVQSIIILWLGSWAIGDYLNNIYVHAYVDASLATYGWIMILALIGGSLGSAWTMVHRRHAAIGKIEKPIKESKKSMPSLPAPTISTPAFQSPAKSGLNPKLAQLGIRTSSLSSISTTASSPEPATPTTTSPVSFTPSPPSSDSGSKPSAELHPAVAALKAELSERRVTLGLVTATVGQDQSPPPTPTFQSQPQPSERPMPSPMETRPLQRIEPANSSPSQPSTVIRPMPTPSPMRPMQSSSPPPARPMQPFSFNRPSQPQLPGQNSSRPVLPSRPIQPGSQDRFEDAVSRAGFIPTQPSQNPNQNPQNHPPTQIPRNVSTVITGIMPKKKDPQDPANQNASGQNSSS